MSDSTTVPVGLLDRLAGQIWPLVLLAFLLRILAILTVQPIPFSDAAGYWERGVMLAQAGAYGDAYHPIGHTLFVAGIVRIFGASLLAVAIAQALLSSAAVWLVYDLGGRTFGRKAGWIAALLFTFHAAHIYYTTLILTEVLFCFLLLMSACFAFRPWGILRWIMAGVCLGLAALVRPFILYFPFFVLPFLLLVRRWRRPAGFGALALVTLALYMTISPRLIHTWRHDGAPLLATNSGVNLLIGNNPGSDGRGAGRTYVDDPERSPIAGIEDPIERSRAARAAAVDWIVHNPKRFVIKGIKAAWALMNYEQLICYFHENGCHAGMPNWLYVALRVLIGLSFPIILLLALPGIFRRSSLGEQALWLGLIVFFLLLHFVGFGQARFRLPLTGFYILFAGKAFVMKGGWLELLGSSGGEGRGGLAVLRAHRASWLLAGLTGLVCLAGWAFKLTR